MLRLLLAFCAIVAKAEEPTLNWGTYRPGYYFGLRARHPQSPLFGFMWYDAGKYEGLSQSRHACQDSDRLSTYGWHTHNAKDFGQQIIFDPLTNLHLTTSFMKFKFENSAEEAWLSVVDGNNIPNGPNVGSGIVGTVWYIIAGDHEAANKNVLSVHDKNIFATKKKYASGQTVQIDGEMDAYSYTYSITQIMDENNMYGQALRPTKKGKLKATTMTERTYITGIHLSAQNKWKSKAIFSQLMEKQARKLYQKSYKIIEKLYPDPQQQQQIYAQFSPNLKHTIIANQSHTPNIFLAQNYLIAPFRIYYLYLPTNQKSITSLSDLPTHINSRHKIDAFIATQMKQFAARFEKTFNIIARTKADTNMEAVYDANGRKYITPGEMLLARYALSNLVGGIGYWHGNQIWQMTPQQKPQYTADMSLLSAVPSRSFFPRGFLWDEGFHQFMIGVWDLDLSLNIIQSWLNNMNEMGWIAREQILGDEARMRVPEEFQVQRPHIANPPTMFLAINALLHRYGGGGDDGLVGIVCDDADEVVGVEVKDDGMQGVSDECVSKVRETKNKIKNFLERNWEALVLHFEWYQITQKSPNDPGRSYRWNGREQHHNLPSGLDDYPRYKNVTRNEGHVDIHCWMIRLYKIMSGFAKYLNKNDEAITWAEKSNEITLSLDEYHWNGDVNAYQDYAMVHEELEGENWSNASGPIIKVFVNHIGYVSAFPFFLQVIDASSPNLKYVLKQLSDENGMWSKYGLRSLAKNDALYGGGEDYWKGAIWINMNYLAVKALYDYKAIYDGDDEEVKNLLEKLYKELRDNLIQNLYNEYAKFGFLYENYNGDTGIGQRSKPFTGWSALILNIIAETYP